MAKNVRRIKRRDESEQEIPVQEAVQDYLNSAHVKKLGAKTRKEYREELQTFAGWCASHTVVQDKRSKAWAAMDTQNGVGVMLHQVDSHTVQCFVEHLQATHKPCKRGKTELSTHTLAGYVRVIKTFLNWCARDPLYGQHVQTVTISRIEGPQIVKTIIDVFTPEQITALFEACSKEESEHLQMRDRAILALLLDTGIRASELVTLTLGHVELGAKDPHIRVFGKGQKWGEIGLGEQARMYLRKYVRTFREPTIEYEVKQSYKTVSSRELAQVTRQVMSQSPCFVNRYGKALQVSGLEQLIYRLGRWAGVEGVRCSPHTFRHTFSVNFIRQGGDIYTLSRLLRHSSVSVTEEYLESLKQSEARRGARSVLDNLR